MATKKIRYRSGYKHQLATEYPITIPIKPKADIDTKFIKLTKTGLLTIIEGYAWDGPSGPVPDTKRNLRASLIHDALYQLMRNRKLTAKAHKDKADKLFKKMCIQDGVERNIAHAYYLGLKVAGKPATDPKNAKKIRTAP